MRPTDFHFDLPEALIAQRPLPDRGDSRLLHLRPDGSVTDLLFTDLADLLESGDLLVLNNTRVLPARLLGRKASGGRVEMLLERILAPDLALVQLRSSRSPGPGAQLLFDGDASAVVEGRRGEFFELRFAEPVEAVLNRAGHMPLPPYIKRDDQPDDRERYQTVFGTETGAVAAPTAGLHFDSGQLNRLRAKGVMVDYLTLHVGAGTFAPLRETQLTSGRLHAERLEVSARLCERVADTRASGSRVVAVGTTVVRGLETAALGGRMTPYSGETELFIRPGFEFRVVDSLLTNFHLPESSLLMLVGALAGPDAVMGAYAHAVSQRYRFFSYGDAMFCHRQAGATGA